MSSAQTMILLFKNPDVYKSSPTILQKPLESFSQSKPIDIYVLKEMKGKKEEEEEEEEKKYNPKVDSNENDNNEHNDAGCKEVDDKSQSRPIYPLVNCATSPQTPTVTIRLPPSPGSSPFSKDDNNDIPFINLTTPPISDSAQERRRQEEAEKIKERDTLLRRRKGMEGERLSLYWVEKGVFW